MMKKGWLTGVAIAWLMTGCGESGPSLVPLSGTVVLNGKPLEGASVVFEPDPTNKEGRPGEGVSDPAGKYSLRTNGRAGLVPGKYRVVVNKSFLDPAKMAPEFNEDPFMAQLSAAGPDMGKDAKKKDGSSGVLETKFDRDVPAEGGTQDFELTMSDKKKSK